MAGICCGTYMPNKHQHADRGITAAIAWQRGRSAYQKDMGTKLTPLSELNISLLEAAPKSKMFPANTPRSTASMRAHRPSIASSSL